MSSNSGVFVVEEDAFAAEYVVGSAVVDGLPVWDEKLIDLIYYLKTNNFK
jgi:hypothetical protein